MGVTVRPVLDPAVQVAFNGDATTDLDAEPFILPAPGTRGGEGFCKTNRKPYDLAVTAVLLRTRLLLPDIFQPRSDGGWDSEWLYGPNPIHSGPIRSGPIRSGAGRGACRLVAQLFGPIPAGTAFTPSTWPH